MSVSTVLIYQIFCSAERDAAPYVNKSPWLENLVSSHQRVYTIAMDLICHNMQNDWDKCPELEASNKLAKQCSNVEQLWHST